jgi:hypothetical protein
MSKNSEFEDVVGPGFDAIPEKSTSRADDYPRCGVEQVPAFEPLTESPTESESKPKLGDLLRTFNIGLDRQSFLDRGWTNEQLGAWDGGSFAARRGLFLSMFYALQNLHPQELGHPWNEQVHAWDRGLGAHIDHWKRMRCDREFYLYVYDNSIPLEMTNGIIVGRNSNEPPFSVGGPCFKPDSIIVGCAGGSRIIYLRTNYSYALGQRIDNPVWIQGSDGQSRFNISYLIAHETGHFFGFPHVESLDSIMNATTKKDGDRPRWQTPDHLMKPLFENIAHQMCLD